VELRNGIALSVLLLAAGCRFLSPPPPAPIVAVPPRVDTVIVTRDIAPPIRLGTPAEVCLSTGQNVTIHISPEGDTLIGAARTRLRDLTGLAFAGAYAAGRGWYTRREDVLFEKRTYTRLGSPARQDCNDLKQVGDYEGVSVFAEITAPAPLALIYVPVRPGYFQAYATRIAAPRR
jgi:hypothetical protein